MIPCAICAHLPAAEGAELCAKCLVVFAADPAGWPVREREEQDELPAIARGEYETRPGPDPHQAIHESYLRWTRGGIEIVRDPMGRVA